MTAPFEPDVGDLNFEDEDLDEDLVDNGDGPICLGCGCSELNPCAGGCVWASATLCSLCA